MPHLSYDRLEFLGGYSVLFQEPGGGVGDAERFALREMHRLRLAIKHKSEREIGSVPPSWPN
jgi:hypothetical protein